MKLIATAVALLVLATMDTIAAESADEQFAGCQADFTDGTADLSDPHGSNATACEALDDLARCIGQIQAKLVEAGTPEKGQQYSLWLQFWQTSFGKYDCANKVDRVVPPSIRTQDKDLVISTDGEHDVQFQRYRRESVSIWDIVAQVNALRTQGTSLEEAYKTAIAAAEDNATLARGSLEDGLKKMLADRVGGVEDKQDALDTRLDGVVEDHSASLSAVEIKLTKQQGDAALDLQKSIGGVTASATAAVDALKVDLTKTIAENKQAATASVSGVSKAAAVTAQLASGNRGDIQTLQATSSTMGQNIAAGASATAALKSTVDGSVSTSIAAATKATQDLRVGVAKSQSCCDSSTATLSKQLGCAAKGLYLKGDACASPTSTTECTASTIGTIALIQTDLSVCATGKENGKLVFQWKPFASTKLENNPGSSKDAPAKSCKEIKDAKAEAESGMYWIRANAARAAESTYCEMTLDGGGWTLVATVHEDNRNARGDKNDRWSSTRGYTGDSYGTTGGDQQWEKDSTFGSPENGAKDDFKSWAYSEMDARDLMVMNVRNGATWQEYVTKASMIQVSTNQFLSGYSPSNMAGIFRRHALRHGCSNQGPNNMRSTKWLKGSHTQMEQWTCPNCRSESEPGAFSFSQCNCEGSRFAFCQVQRQGCNIEHFCIGSSFVSGHGPAATNDFAGWDWHYLNSGWSRSWAVSGDYYSHAVFFLYR